MRRTSKGYVREDRLVICLRKPHLPAEQLADAILNDLTQFQGGQDRFDDETMIVLRVVAPMNFGWRALR